MSRACSRISHRYRGKQCLQMRVTSDLPGMGVCDSCHRLQVTLLVAAAMPCPLVVVHCSRHPTHHCDAVLRCQTKPVCKHNLPPTTHQKGHEVHALIVRLMLQCVQQPDTCRTQLQSTTGYVPRTCRQRAGAQELTDLVQRPLRSTWPPSPRRPWRSCSSRRCGKGWWFSIACVTTNMSGWRFGNLEAGTCLQGGVLSLGLALMTATAYKF